MPVKFKHQNESITIQVPEWKTLKEALSIYGRRRIEIILEKAIANAYIQEARRRLKRGKPLEYIREVFSKGDWMPPGRMPESEEDKLLKSFRGSSPEVQKAFLSRLAEQRKEAQAN
jgi:hypothetical protein